MALTRVDAYLIDLDSTGGITFDDQAGIPTFKVNSTTHRVGIGTATPVSLLEVAGVVTATTFVGALTGNVTGSASSVVNAATFNSGGAGAVSGTTFNGSATQVISYNTVGASPLAGSSSLTTTGTVTSGTWSGLFGAVSGANLTSLTAGNLSGTIPSAVLGNSSCFIGTTSIALNRASASQALEGILSVAMFGSTSGAIVLQPAAVAGLNTITLPASTGTVALTNNTLYVGTTAISLGRASATQALTGITSIDGSSASCTGNAATASSVVNTVAGTGSIELVRGNMADNDHFRILVGGTATNAGYVEIATADDGTEPIYVRQYTGVFSSLTRTATLLDGSGNTSFPGTVTATGNVGIGTTSPGSVLDVRFPSSPATDNGAGLNAIRSFTTSAFAINTGGAISLGGVYASGGEVAAFGQIAGRKENATSGDLWGYLQFSTNSGGGTMVERMRISGPGNVGIGSTAPGTKLDVSGNIRGERYVGINSLVLNTYTTINPSSNVFLYSQPNDRDSWIYLDSADTGSNWGIYHRQIDSAVADLPGNSIGFVGGGATAVQSYISLQTGNAYFRGNVGIGSTQPGENITVYRSVDAGSQVRNDNASAGSNAFAAYRLSSDAVGGAWWWLNSSARTVDGGANTSTIRNDAGDMRLQAAGEVGLHIKASTGNIGIGVSNPSAKLTVDGSINQTWSDVRLGIFYDSSFRQGLAYSTSERTLKIFSTTSDSGGNIAFYTRNGLGASDTDYGTQRMVISAAGNVGIGTTNPGVPLDVRGTDSLIRASETGSGTAWRARIISHNPDGAVQRASFLGVYGTSAGVFAHNAALNGWAPLFVNTTSGSSDGDTVILAGSGSVGIGTASPLAKLHVNATGRAATIGGTPAGPPSGTVATQTSYLELVAGSGGNTNSSAVIFHNPGVSTAALEYLNADANTGYFNFKSDDASWNVGIGTTAPGHKLDVAGNIRLGAQVLGGVATPPHLNLGQNYSSTTLRANCKIRLYDNDANDVYGFGIGSNGDIQYHSTTTHQFYNSDVATLLVNGTAPYYKGNIIWHSGNDGAGSGLDADLLDGISSASFVRSDSRSTIGINGRTAAYTGSNLELHTGDNTPPGISFHRGGVSAVNLYESNGYLYQDRWVGGGGLIWTSGNDGTGSGLDADLWDGYQLSVRTNWLDNSAQNIVVGQLAWKNYGNLHTIFDASQGTSPDGTSVNNTNPQAGWQGTFPTLMGWNGANTYGVRVDSARVSDTLISNATVARDLYISGGIGGNYGNRLVVGGTDAVFTAQDSNLRPTIQATGQYPVISLNHTLTGNTNHGPTLQFTCNGVGHQFVIGTTGNGSRMDIGFSSTAGWNPHNGINNYQGTTSMSFATDGNVGIGTLSPTSKLHVNGSLSKTSGSFKIDHPIPEKSETHYLVHSFVESPQANNIYRGKVTLTDGSATVNLDEVSGLTEGTFVLLNRDIHCFTSNETDWDNVKGSVNENILTITCQNPDSTAVVTWLVIGERHDQHMYDTDWTDENGRVITEPLKGNSEL